jgi:hypothetical protein
MSALSGSEVCRVAGEFEEVGPPSAFTRRGSVAVWDRKSADTDGPARKGGLRAHDDNAVDRLEK